MPLGGPEPLWAAARSPVGLPGEKCRSAASPLVLWERPVDPQPFSSKHREICKTRKPAPARQKRWQPGASPISQRAHELSHTRRGDRHRPTHAERPGPEGLPAIRGTVPASTAGFIHRDWDEKGTNWGVTGVQAQITHLRTEECLPIGVRDHTPKLRD